MMMLNPSGAKKYTYQLVISFQSQLTYDFVEVNRLNVINKDICWSLIPEFRQCSFLVDSPSSEVFYPPPQPHS